MLPEYIIKLLDGIAKQQDFIDYKFEMKSGSNHGDNFLGVMTSVTLTGTKVKNGTSNIETMHLICKIPPMNESRKKNFKSSIVFDREVYVYSKLLPAFIKFQRDRGLSEADSFVSFPKVYACESNEKNGTHVLIMEDLRPQNYEMWPKEKAIPIDHELLVMKELGKFHAISFAMKDQIPNEFEKFKQLNDTFCEIVLDGKFSSFMDRTIERATDALINPEHKEMMIDFKKSYKQMLKGYFSLSSCDRFGVVGHGDCWINNFLFQYCDENKNRLQSICLLDWQITRYCSPVMDLLYNIFSGTDKELRDEHFESLLKTYHLSLRKTIERLGSDPDKLYTFENFQMEMKKFGKFALLTGPMIIQFRVANAKDIRDLDEYSERVENGEEADLLNDYDEETQMVYSKQINDLVKDLLKYGYVNKND